MMRPKAGKSYLHASGACRLCFEVVQHRSSEQLEQQSVVTKAVAIPCTSAMGVCDKHGVESVIVQGSHDCAFGVELEEENWHEAGWHCAISCQAPAVCRLLEQARCLELKSCLEATAILLHLEACSKQSAGTQACCSQHLSSEADGPSTQPLLANCFTQGGVARKQTSWSAQQAGSEQTWHVWARPVDSMLIFQCVPAGVGGVSGLMFVPFSLVREPCTLWCVKLA